MELIRNIVAGVALLALAACNATPREIMMGHQGVFNAGVTAENSYASQKFCGEEGALPPPGCAKAELVIKMADGSNDAKVVLDAGWAAVNDPNFDPKSLPSILNAVASAVGAFRGILASNGVDAPPAVPATQ
jgi:hypothetical protein